MQSDTVDPALSWRWFAFGCAVELALGLVAILIGPLIGRPVLANLHWNISAAFWGLAGTIPLLAALVWVVRTPSQWCREITRFLDDQVRPVFGRWSVPQFAVISALAGFGEELLFRGLLQGELTRFLGTTAALLTASVLFGAFHWVTRGYAVFATVIGAYLGLLWVWSDNLLVPIIAHALYDLIALVYFFRIRPERR